MSRDVELLEKIDLYLDGKLSEEQARSFKNELEKNSSLAQTVEIQKATNQFVIGAKLQALKSMMDEDFTTGRVSGGNSNTKWFWVLGSAVVLSIVAYVIVVKKSSIKQEVVAIQNVKKESIQNNETYSAKQHTRDASKTVKASTEKRSEIAQSKNQEVKQSEQKVVSGISIPTEVNNIPIVAVKPNDGGIETKPQENVTNAIVSEQEKKKETAVKQSVSEKVEDTKKETIGTNPTISFKPEYAEVATIPLHSREEVKIEIMNRAGVVQLTDVISGQEEYLWDGKNQQGGISLQGLYIYVLQYHSGKKVTGQIILY